MSFYQNKIQSDFGQGCLFRNCKWTANTVQLGLFVKKKKTLLVTSLQQDKNFSIDHAHSGKNRFPCAFVARVLDWSLLTFRIDIINNWYIDDEVRYNMENYANLFLFSSTLYAYYIFLRKLIFTDIILDVSCFILNSWNPTLEAELNTETNLFKRRTMTYIVTKNLFHQTMCLNWSMKYPNL